MADPLRYYENNVVGTMVLLDAMNRHGVKRIVFSSSATVYGITEKMPLTEDSPVGAVNPYGHSKVMVEQILRDIAAADDEWRIMLLRYFNPVGAHESGLIGEDPAGVPNNLMPFVAQVASGRRPRLRIFGNDYPTVDGTGVRDYIHVVDVRIGACGSADRALGRQRPARNDRQPRHRTRAFGVGGRADVSKPRAADPCLMTLSTAGRGMWPPAMPMRRARERFSVGRRGAASTRCAPTPGVGRRPIRRDFGP